MDLETLLRKGIIVKEATTQEEIFDLFKIVERDYKDSSQTEISVDWQFGIAYNAALKLATIPIRYSGFRVKGLAHHMHTFAMIPLLLGKEKKELVIYLEACRRKRNALEYESIGDTSANEVTELRNFVYEFNKLIVDWIKNTKLF